MEKQNLQLIRDFLFKTFIVGLLLAVLLLVLTIIFWDHWSAFIHSKFLVTEKELGEMFVSSMLHLRLYLTFIILAPAIALHLMLKCKKSK